MKINLTQYATTERIIYEANGWPSRHGVNVGIDGTVKVHLTKLNVRPTHIVISTLRHSLELYHQRRHHLRHGI